MQQVTASRSDAKERSGEKKEDADVIDLNRVTLAGNLVRDPQERATQSGNPVCGLRVAVNRQYTGRNGEAQEETCYLDVDVFGGQAGPCIAYLKKGSPVLVEGRLRQDEWEDKETGAKRSRIKVVASRVQFLESSRAPEANGVAVVEDQSFDNGSER